VTRSSSSDSSEAGPAWDAIERLVATMQEHQAKKVFELARRLLPNVTMEDVKNPHDFPELDDKDWHYEDGVLTGIESVLTALRAARTRP
jgi:hypothetical protein